MPSLQEIVERLSAAESDEMDELELVDMLRLEFQMSEDEAQDIRNALEDRGLLQIRGTGRIALVNRYNPEASYDALEAAAEDITPLSARIGRRDPEHAGATYSADSEGNGEELDGEEDLADAAFGRTPPGAPAESLEHLRDLSLHGELKDMDANGEYIVADPSGDLAFGSTALVEGSRFHDEESLMEGKSETFEHEESAPYSTRSDDAPYDPRGTG